MYKSNKQNTFMKIKCIYCNRPVITTMNNRPLCNLCLDLWFINKTEERIISYDTL